VAESVDLDYPANFSPIRRLCKPPNLPSRPTWKKYDDPSRFLSSIGVGEITSLEDGLKDLAQKLSKHYSLGQDVREILDGWFH
jgi:hypothetical protein